MRQALPWDSRSTNRREEQMRNIGIALALACILAFASPGAAAQQKSVRILVGLAAGGSLDTMTRLVAEKLRVSLGQPVIVENRAGASGLIAIDALRAAPVDGSVLMAAASGSITLLPNTFKSQRFDPTRDFSPVAQIAQIDFVLTVNPGVPARTVAEFAAAARSDPKYRVFGSAPGTTPHLIAMQFARAAGIAAVHVPYKGNAQALIDLVGGQIHAAFPAAGEVMELSKSGKVRMLAVAGARRSALLPDVPTLKESGFDAEGNAWFALFAPAGTPEPVVERLGRAAVDATETADLRERLAHAGIEAAGLLPRDLAAKIRSEYDQIARELRASGFKLQD
jgi:tripartite-type tricarboxylate transporter receptor subunit TctC